MHPLEKQNVFLDTVEIKRVDSFNKETSDKIVIVGYIKITVTIRLSGNFLSFYEEIIEAQGFFVLYYFVELCTNHFIILFIIYEHIYSLRQTPRHFTDLVSRLS